MAPSVEFDRCDTIAGSVSERIGRRPNSPVMPYPYGDEAVPAHEPSVHLTTGCTWEKAEQLNTVSEANRKT